MRLRFAGELVQRVHLCGGQVRIMGLMNEKERKKEKDTFLSLESLIEHKLE